MIKTGQAWAGLFVTLDATGAASAADSAPTGTLYVDGASDAATVTITGSNPYKFAVTLPSLTAGQRVDMYIAATIDTIATAGIVASAQADTVLISDVKAETALILADTGTDGVVVNATQGAITWGQQKIIAPADDEGALHIVNTGDGVGIYTKGAFAGQFNQGTDGSSCGTFNIGVAFGLNNQGYTGQYNQGSHYGLENLGTTQAVHGYDPALALEATLTAIKGAGWTDETLVKIITDISNISAGSGATPQQVWEYATRTLTAGTNIDLSSLATATDLAAVKSVADDILVDTGTTLDGNITAILADTNEVQAELADGGRTDLLIDAIKAKSDLIPASPAEAGEYTTAIAALQTDLDNPDQYKADVSALAKATDLQDVENKVDLIDVTTVANGGKIDAVDTKVSAIDTDTVMSFVIDGFTFEQIVQIMASVLAGKLTRSGDTLTFRDLADTVNRVVAETDANKQRTDITYTV